MPWSVQILPEPRVIETVYAGVLSARELKAAIQATEQCAKAERIALLLADCVELAGGHSIFDLYKEAEGLAQEPVPVRFREALLLPQQQTAIPNVEFWETACLNRGFNVRIFDDRTKALAWLRLP